MVLTLFEVSVFSRPGLLEYSVGAVVWVLIVLMSVLVLAVGAVDAAPVGGSVVVVVAVMGMGMGMGGDEVPYSGMGDAASI